jgi:ribosomal protein S25
LGLVLLLQKGAPKRQDRQRKKERETKKRENGEEREEKNKNKIVATVADETQQILNKSIEAATIITTTLITLKTCTTLLGFLFDFVF